MPPADRDYVQLRVTRGVLAAGSVPGPIRRRNAPAVQPPEDRAAGAPLMVSTYTAIKPVRAMGGFFAMSLDTFVQMFKPPFAWKEYILQSWFVARVSVLPALMLTMPYSVLLVFTFNVLLTEFGAVGFLRHRRRDRHREPDRPDRHGAGGLRRRCHRHVRRSRGADHS